MQKSRSRIQKKLEHRLRQLKRTLNYGHELSVRWRPGCVRSSSGRILAGKVVNRDVIEVYDEHEADALATLAHEFVEYVVARELVSPYQNLVNGLISAIEREAYHRRERVVENLVNVLNLKRDAK